MDAIRMLRFIVIFSLLTTALAIPVHSQDALKSARRRVIIYYNTDQPPVQPTRSSAIAASVPFLTLNTNGTVSPSISNAQPNSLPISLFTAQINQQPSQTRPITSNQNYARPSEDVEYVPPTKVPPPSLVPSTPVKAVTAPLKGSELAVEMLPPLFIPVSGSWDSVISTLSPFAVFVPRRSFDDKK